MATPLDNEEQSGGTAIPPPLPDLSRLSIIDFTPLDPNYAKVNAATNLIGWGIMLPIIAGIDRFAPNAFVPWFIYVIVLLITLSSCAYGYFYALSCGYRREAFDLLFKQGVWWKKQTALSFSRIQHIDISHGPIERRFGLATIKFFTAGGALSDLKIPGINRKLAEEIRTDVLQFAKEEYAQMNETDQSE